MVCHNGQDLARALHGAAPQKGQDSSFQWNLKWTPASPPFLNQVLTDQLFNITLALLEYISTDAKDR